MLNIYAFAIFLLLVHVHVLLKEVNLYVNLEFVDILLICSHTLCADYNDELLYYSVIILKFN